MLLLYENEAEAAARTPAQDAAHMAARRALAADLARAGKYEGHAPLDTTATATTVRVRSGKMMVTDGPFADTPEQLAGCCLVNARDLDDAIAIAARMPTAQYGSVEIRPVRAAVGGMTAMSTIRNGRTTP